MGRPVTLADLLDYSRSSPPRRVQVRLTTSELVGEEEVSTQLVAGLTWEFADRRLTCQQVCGRIGGDWTWRPEAAVAQANRRVEHLLEELVRTGAALEGSEARFVARPPWVASMAESELTLA